MIINATGPSYQNQRSVPTATVKTEDLVKLDFTSSAPNEKWLNDITELACKDGKLYLYAVIDCFDGAIWPFNG